MRKRRITKETAVRRLTNRYWSEVARYPTLLRDVPLSVYLAANLPHMLTQEPHFFERYDSVGSV